MGRDTFWNQSRDAWRKENSDDIMGHGTSVAALAVGATVGVAPMADLVCVKMNGDVRIRTSTTMPDWDGVRANEPLRFSVVYDALLFVLRMSTWYDHSLTDICASSS